MRQVNEKAVHVQRHRDNIARFTIPEDGTLLAIAMQVLRDHKPAKVKSYLRHHQLAVNGIPLSQYNYPVHSGDVLEVNFDRSFEVFSHPRLKIVYEDRDIIVVDKDYGLLSTGTGKEKDDTVFSIMRRYVKRGSEHAHVYVVHRLDRDTSGLMVLTRTGKARDRLIKEWDKMVTERSYIAVVEGIVDTNEGVIKARLIDDDANYEVHVTANPKEGKAATTRYSVVHRGSRNTMLRVEMAKGHKNQIRVHLKHIGHPVSGDRKYGAHPNGIHRLALHAHTLRFFHPVTGEELRFEAPVPQGFNSLL